MEAPNCLIYPATTRQLGAGQNGRVTLPKTWELPLAGFVVNDIWFSGRIGIVTYKSRGKGDWNAPNAKLWFGGPFTFQDGLGQVHDLDAGDPWESLTPLFELRHQFIERAVANDSSQIEVRFERGLVLAAGPSPQYENWEVSGPDGLNLVGMPGGGDPRISGNLG